MHITRIYAKNFKTYKDLDLDLEVNPERPIVLIGGKNGGGKTTLFQAIYAALYGLEIKDAQHFQRLFSASVAFNSDSRIELEIDFKGQVLTQEYIYKIKRIYILNAQQQPMESVTLNFNGELFTYGTAMPFSQRAKTEAEVNKIIKANLPKELSRYFLFDAMESGNLLKEDYLSRVIKENIENVMGFNKYTHLKDATTKVKEFYLEESLSIESEREEFKNLVEQKDIIENRISKLKEDRQVKLGYSIDKKEFYRKAKDGINLQKEFQEQIQYIENKVKEIKAKQGEYLDAISKYTQDVEVQAFLPKLINIIYEELELILNQNDTTNAEVFSQSQIDFIKESLIEFFAQKDLSYQGTSGDFISFLEEKISENKTENPYGFLSVEEVNTLKLMLNHSSINNYNFLMHNKESLEKELLQLPILKNELEEAKSHLTSDDTSIIDLYEKNESQLIEIKTDIDNLEADLKRISSKINQYDIPHVEVPNPKLELCKKLEPLLNEISNTLLKTKKERIEQTMKDDLNLILGAYKDQIDRVELSENLSDLTFKVYHKAGNEIYLEELNAASKQIIVQVLLKALHQFGDYNPPVMIDTVMGYLGDDSREALLEYYFPKLSHQTILLSTETEIIKNGNLKKIDEFISKKYTLVRDVEKQLTIVEEGYFNK